MNYAELHCISNFTFLRGASHPAELVRQAVHLGYTALALTDECSVAGAVRAHVAAVEHGLHLIIGSEFKLTDGQQLVLLARNRNGYRQLVQLITQGRRAAPKGHYQLSLSDIGEGRLSDCLALLPCDPNLTTKDDMKERYTLLTQHADSIKTLMPNCTWLALEQSTSGFDRQHLTALRSIGKQLSLPLVATGNVHMHSRSRQPLQDILTSIRLGTTVDDAGHHLFSNGERHLRSPVLLQRLYPPALLQQSVVISEQCSFSLTELRYQYPQKFISQPLNAAEYLRKLTYAGMQTRWPTGAPESIYQQIAHELSLIEELSYEAYFLTVHDIVNFARHKNILCQGRGSAANSAVCYCLGITEVDPARMNLLFERFISRERNEPPDIDIDFEHERREEVMQYVYRKYGRDHAAMTATVITYRPRSALRDVGNALGLKLAQVNRLAADNGWWEGGTINPRQVRKLGLNPENPPITRLLALVKELVGFPRHLSQHSGGFIISHEPLCDLVPIENAAMAERTVIQWDKNDINTLGLLKVDCLSLGMLSAIHRCFDLIKKHGGNSWTMATIPTEDPVVYDMMGNADTIGVFQIESRAQMAMLPRLRPVCFYDLVIEVAIVRPGPIQGDMVHPYLKRRQGHEAVTYPNDAMRQVLGRTLGIPIFQEQVIKLAVVAAGFTPGEADNLRRAMGAWRRHGDLSDYKEMLVNGMCERGYPESFAKQIYQQILGFGEYGFPEAHAASFALLVYVSAWLKYHQPAAFTCALLNSQPMGFYAPAQLIQDARRHGVQVKPIDVTVSDWESTLEQDKETLALRLGLHMINGFSQTGAIRLLNARADRAFRDLQDFAQRTCLNKTDLQALAAANAFIALVRSHRKMAYWEVAGISTPAPILNRTCFNEGTPMIPKATPIDDAHADYASIGLTLGPHPLALIRSTLSELGLSTREELYRQSHGKIAKVAGLVIARQRPASANNVTFVTLEDETGSINLVVWKNIAEQYASILLDASVIGASGKIQRKGDVLHLLTDQLIDLSYLIDNLTIQSRDFR
ncbi:MAG: error-prone DNA polymerase [Gammaproteobacteria bacterium]|nr:error-prone DNA polymerase [Gammaproteobacteria bacterium]